MYDNGDVLSRYTRPKIYPPVLSIDSHIKDAVLHLHPAVGCLAPCSLLVGWHLWAKASKSSMRLRNIPTASPKHLGYGTWLVFFLVQKGLHIRRGTVTRDIIPRVFDTRKETMLYQMAYCLHILYTI